MDDSFDSRILTRGFLFLALIFTAAGCSKLSQPLEPLVIGHVAPRSGPDQALGIREGEAVAQAVTNFNVDESHRINNQPIAVIHGDSGSDLDGFAFQATRLLAVNQAKALIGGTNAAELEKLMPVIQTHQVALVSPCGGTADPLSRLTFCVGIDPKERGRILGKYAAEDRNWKDVAVIVDATNPLFLVMSAAFVKEFQTAERKIRNEFDFRNRTELPDLAVRLAKAKPTALVFAGKARDAIALRAELVKAGYPDDFPIMFLGEEEEAALVRDPDAAKRVIWTTAFTADDHAKKVEDFCGSFRTRTGVQTPDVAAALSYDAARILFIAAQKNGSFQVKEPKKNLRDELRQFSEPDGLTGPFWFTPDQTARRTVYVVQLTDGKPKLAKAYPPEKK